MKMKMKIALLAVVLLFLTGCAKDYYRYGGGHLYMGNQKSPHPANMYGDLKSEGFTNYWRLHGIRNKGDAPRTSVAKTSSSRSRTNTGNTSSSGWESILGIAKQIADGLSEAVIANELSKSNNGYSSIKPYGSYASSSNNSSDLSYRAKPSNSWNDLYSGRSGNIIHNSSGGISGTIDNNRVSDYGGGYSVKSGNKIQYSNGVMGTVSGDTVYRNDGTSSTIRGGYIYHSDGTSSYIR